MGQILVDFKDLQVADVENLRFRLLGAGHIHVAVLVGGRHRGKEDVRGGAAFLDGGNGRVDVVRHIVDPARVVLFPQSGAVEHGIDFDGAAQVVVHNEWIFLVGVGAPDVHVVDMVGHLVKPPQDVPGLIAVKAVIDDIPVVDHVQGVVHGDEFGPVQRFQFFFHISIRS